MPWPQSQDYNEAIQNPQSSFGDPELRGGQAVTNAMGMPMPRSGNFADVYEFIGASGQKWAIKCFTRQIPGLQERYGDISKSLAQAKLPFMVDFEYLAKGIRIRGEFYPILKMQWVEGFLLNEFVRNNLDKPVLLTALSQVWLRMASALRRAGFAHADLQHGNVILVPGSKAASLSVRLIDYDGMWVPALAGKKSGEVGHANYQHPQRLRSGLYSSEVDRFPHLVIHTALRSLILAGSNLWNKFDNGDNLLFKQADLESPSQSPLFRELAALDDPEVKKLVHALAQAVQSPLEQTPLLEELAKRQKKSSVVLAAGGMEATPGSAFADVTAATEVARPRARARQWSRAGIILTGIVVLAGVIVGGVLLAISSKSKSKDPIVVKREPANKKSNSSAKKKDAPPSPVDPMPVEEKGDIIPARKVFGKATVSGSWRIDGEDLVHESLNTFPNIVFGDPGWSNYDLTLKAKLEKGDSGFLIRYHQTSQNDFCCFGVGVSGNTVHELAYVSGGKWGRYDGGFKFGIINQDNWYDIRIEVREDHVRCFLEGNPIFEHRDQQYKLGQIGLATWGSACRFRDIRVTAPDGKLLWYGVPDLELADRETIAQTNSQSTSKKQSPMSQTLVLENFKTDLRMLLKKYNAKPTWGMSLLVIEIERISSADKTPHQKAMEIIEKLEEMPKSILNKTFKLDLQGLLEDENKGYRNSLERLSGKQLTITWAERRTPLLQRTDAPENPRDDSAKNNKKPPVLTPYGTFIGHDATVRHLLFTEDGSRLVSATNGNTVTNNFVNPGKDNSVRVWDTKTGRQIHYFGAPKSGFTYGVQGIGLSPNCMFVAAVTGWQWGGLKGENSRITVWDMNTGIRKQHVVLPGDRSVRAVEFGTDGRTLYAARSSPAVHKLSFGGYKVSSTIDLDGQNPNEAPFGTIFTPDRRHVLGPLSGNPPQIRLWDLDGKIVKSYIGHTALPSGVAMSLDGTRILSCANDRTVRLWDTDSGRELFCLNNLESNVASVAFSPDGKEFLTGGEDGSVILREAISGNELALPRPFGESHERRVFTDHEIRGFRGRR